MVPNISLHPLTPERERYEITERWGNTRERVNRTITSIGNVLQEADIPEQIGLQIPIETIRGDLIILREIRNQAITIIDTYENARIFSFPKQAIRSRIYTFTELVLWGIGLGSFVLDNIEDRESNTLKWTGWACVLLAGVANKAKEWMLLEWLSWEKYISELKVLKDQTDIVDSTESLIKILNVFQESVKANQRLNEEQWIHRLEEFEGVPTNYRRILPPRQLQIQCMRTITFQGVIERVIEQIRQGPQRPDSPSARLIVMTRRVESEIEQERTSCNDPLSVPETESPGTERPEYDTLQLVIDPCG